MPGKPSKQMREFERFFSEKGIAYSNPEDLLARSFHIATDDRAPPEIMFYWLQLFVERCGGL